MFKKLRSWFERSKKRDGQPPPDPGPTTLTAAIAVLAGWIETMIGSAEVWKMPQLINEGPAAHASDNAGRLDASRAPFDDYSHDPRLPHQNTVVSIVVQLLDLIGNRAYSILSAYDTGRLTEPLGVFDVGKGWQRTSWLTRGLILLAGILEMWLGATLWERLIGAGDSWSWLVGLVWALIATIGTLAAADWIIDHRPGLLQDRGLFVAGLVAAVFGLLLTAYAFALSGGATAQPTTGGVSGGVVNGTSQVTSSADNEVNWVLMTVYLGAMAFIALVVLFSHVHDLAVDKKRATSARLAALDAQHDPHAQLLLCIQLLEACIILAHQAKSVIRMLIRAYVGGARSVLAPALSSLWDTYELENVEIADPAWIKSIREEIERLKHKRDRLADEDGDPPSLGLVQAS